MEDKSSLIIDCQLFPCIDYFKNLIAFKDTKIELYDNFKKMTFRNRYVIPGANGLHNLTVPVVGGREQRVPMREVRIDNSTNWQVKHWRSLVSAYRKAPFFDYYASGIQELLFSKEESLLHFNIKTVTWANKALNNNRLVGFTKEYIVKFGDTLDYRDRILPKNFQLDQEDWKPKYSQVFEDRLGFQPNVSIIDLLFCEGPNSLNLLERSVK